MKKILYTAVIISLALVVIQLIPNLKESFINPFQNRNLTAKSLKELETTNVAEFRSSRYTYKSLFPYDFIYGYPKWGVLLYKHKKFLTSEDMHNINFYYKCKDIGVDLNDNHIFTLSTNATAGFYMDDYIYSKPLIYTDEELGRIVLKKPETKILTMEFLDTLRDENFPKVKISPGEWQRLMELLKPEIEKDIIEKGLLETADKSNRLFIENLFLSIGWKKVEFK